MAAILVTAAAVLMITFMSNTATAAFLVPATLALSPDEEKLAMLAALERSFAMALPVSTPPNAIAYSTG